MMNRVKNFFYSLYRLLSKSRLNKWNELTFIRESDDRWYAYLKWWPFKKKHLEMVSGSADFLDCLEAGHEPAPRRLVTLQFFPTDELHPEFDAECYLAECTASHLTRGSFYKTNAPFMRAPLYLCPVTLFVLSRYPKYIYIRKDADVKAKQ